MKTYIIFNQYDEEKNILKHQLVSELVKRGNIVIYYSALRYKQQINKLGAEFREYPVTCKPYFQDDQLSRLHRDKEQLNIHQQIASRLVAEVVLERPTCLIYDSDCLFAKLIAKEANIPFVSLIASYVLTEVQLKEWEGDSTNKLQRLKQYVSRIINKIEAISIKGESEERSSQHEFSSLNLVCTNKKFQPYAALLDETFDYIGYPIDYQTKAIETLDWDSLKPPFTYVSMTQKTMLSKGLLRQLCELEGTVIIDLDSVVMQEALENLPPFITLVNHKLSECDWNHLDLLISDASLNLTNLALKHQIPLLMFPKTEMQGLIAFRIEECLLGILGDEGNAEQLKRALDFLLYDEHYKANVKLFSESFLEVTSGQKMICKIEKFLNEQNK